MGIQWPALASFVLVTTFTPGPNNISAMSLGMSYGYRRSLRYVGGITVGFCLVMAACAIVDRVLVQTLPRVEPYLKAASSLYVVWLAVQTFRGSREADTESRPSLGFRDGLLLQLLNPKVIGYGLALYSSFLLSLAATGAGIAVSAVGLALVGFAAVSCWAAAGSYFARWLRRPVVRRVTSAILALLLLYSAVESSGLLALWR